MKGTYTYDCGHTAYGYPPSDKINKCIDCWRKERRAMTTEELRADRTERAKKKCDRLQYSIDIRQKEIDRIDEHQSHYRGDIALATQPGHIPLRSQLNREREKQFRLQQEVDRLKQKQDSIMTYKTRVKGDAEQERQLKRERNDERFSKGARVNDPCFGDGTIMRVNKKSYTIKFDTGFECARDKSYVGVGLSQPTKRDALSKLEGK